MKRITICGRKIEHRADAREHAVGPEVGEPARRQHRAREPARARRTPPSIASIAGTAHAKMLWKSRTITSAKTATPASGCSSTRSMRSVRVSGASVPAPIVAARVVDPGEALLRRRRRAAAWRPRPGLRVLQQRAELLDADAAVADHAEHGDAEDARQRDQVEAPAARLGSSIMVRTRSVGKPSARAPRGPGRGRAAAWWRRPRRPARRGSPRRDAVPRARAATTCSSGRFAGERSRCRAGPGCGCRAWRRRACPRGARP